MLRQAESSCGSPSRGLQKTLHLAEPQFTQLNMVLLPVPRPFRKVRKVVVQVLCTHENVVVVINREQ